ncbi:MAG: ribonuclease III domain-containing protein [Candidatus Muiribacteriaceae bacterium]
MLKSELPYIVLAYIGDVVFELRVRNFFIKGKKFSDIREIHRKVVDVVNGQRQATFLRELKENTLNSEELEFVRRVRNHKSSGRKHIERESTGFEALLGYLYDNSPERLDFILDKVEAMYSDD